MSDLAGLLLLVAITATPVVAAYCLYSAARAVSRRRAQWFMASLGLIGLWWALKGPHLLTFAWLIATTGWGH